MSEVKVSEKRERGPHIAPGIETGVESVELPEKQQSWWLRRPQPTVVFDFDGVIHSYKSGWKGETEIPDPPVPGIREAIAHIRLAGYRVVVVSTRGRSEEGRKAIQDWLTENGIEVDNITPNKPPAVCYIDDRAICFDGHPETLLEKINNFKPWNHTEDRRKK